ncbi:MAG TPA: prepilin-type N-terminal cleavage/methylation domain-containing protein [Candidatus Binataceae bacterium]|nr:prepilin-type N-terminal cleavage/methylation domain-containing protein [Candidatus Binataceae bacterium]
MKRSLHAVRAGFTLLEVMIAIAFIGVAATALLSLHHTNLQSVIKAQNLTRAAMLAQGLMSQAELDRFPQTGMFRGDFAQLYPGEYRNFRWEREVVQSPLFPDIEKVRVSVLYGPGFRDRFTLVEFLRNPSPPEGSSIAPGQASPAPTPGSQG